MYLLGHIGFLLLVNFIVEKYVEYEIPYKKFILAVGTMVPDFLDKSIGGFIFNHGRWIGHSLIVQTTVFVTILIILHYNPSPIERLSEYAGLMYIAAIAHLIFDLPSLEMTVMFWPFNGSFPPGSSNSFLLGIHSPIVIIEELIGLASIITIGLYEKWKATYWYIVIFTILAYISLFSIFYTLFVVY